MGLELYLCITQAFVPLMLRIRCSEAGGGVHWEMGVGGQKLWAHPLLKQSGMRDALPGLASGRGTMSGQPPERLPLPSQWASEVAVAAGPALRPQRALSP